jgi:hypothetical protein
MICDDELDSSKYRASDDVGGVIGVFDGAGPSFFFFSPSTFLLRT